MPYTRAWDETRPNGATVNANLIDDEMRFSRVDLRERIAGIFGLSALQFAADPIAPISLALSAGLTAATVAASAGFTGNITGNLTGNSTGTHTGAVVGTTVTASSYFAQAATTRHYLDGVAGTGDTYILEPSSNVMQFFTGAIQSFELSTTYSYSPLDFIVAATKKLRIDGSTTGDTYIYESSANALDIVVGGTTALMIRGGSVFIPATNKLYLDGGGDTYIYESAANVVRHVVGGADALVMTTTTAGFSSNLDVIIGAAKKFYIDGFGDTYIYESAANQVDIFTGGAFAVRFTSSSAILTATGKLYLDGGVDTYIYESGANVMRLVAGSFIRLTATDQYVEINNAPLIVGAAQLLRLDGSFVGDTYINEPSSNLFQIVVGGVGGFQITATSTRLNADGVIGATQKFYLDGGGDTYIAEVSANTVQIIAGSVITFSANTTLTGTNNDLYVQSTKRFYLDGVGDTWVYESTANQIDIVTGASVQLRLSQGAGLASFFTGMAVPATSRIFADAGGDTYMYEVSANQIHINTGGVTSMFFVATGAGVSSGNKIWVDSGGDTYITESSANTFDIVAGATTAARITAINAGFSGTISTAGTVSGTGLWNLGVYVAGVVAATGYVEVNINSTLYKLITRL